MGKRKKTGGRKPGSVNKRTRRILDIIGDGLEPLPFMLAIMRDPSADPVMRADMAKAAAPYCHAKKATAIELSGQLKVVRVKAPELNG